MGACAASSSARAGAIDPPLCRAFEQASMPASRRRHQQQVERQPAKGQHRRCRQRPTSRAIASSPGYGHHKLSGKPMVPASS